MQAQIRLWTNLRMFEQPDGNQFVELHYAIPSEDLEFKLNDKGNLQALVKVNLKVVGKDSLMLKQSFNLYSQERDEDELRFDITDIKRFELPPGKYKVYLRVEDPFSLEYGLEKIALEIKDIPLDNSVPFWVDQFFRVGTQHPMAHGNYLIIPALNRELFAYRDTIWAYMESYQSDSFLVQLAGPQGKIYYTNVSASGNFGQLLFPFPTADLPAGQCNLFIRSLSDGKLIHSLPVIIPGKMMDGDFMALRYSDLLYYLRPLKIIGAESEIARLELLKSVDDSTGFKREFRKFWESRDSVNAFAAWTYFTQLIKRANEEFKTSQREGYLTNRGIVFLQYGPPADIIEFHDNPATYPYEIWVYFNDMKSGNSRFVFANFSFAPGEFELIHSDAVGEARNPQWRQLIQRAATRDGGINKRNWGGQWEKEFINE